MTVMHRIITDRLTQKVTFTRWKPDTTVRMSDDAAARSQRIIKRTLTITTTETWVITVGPAPEIADRPTESDAAQDIIDQIADPISQDNQEEQP
ncbi:MAG: hypothetical protein HGB05_11405 [Chloroflexi bacterium]|nr:hypothetical protein [Chloroflexota bacterium]